MQKRINLAAISGLLAVGLGAFGAHALRSRLEAAGSTATWQTAVLYHLVHALAILAVARASPGGPARVNTEKWLDRAAWSWALGIVLFSGSLYALALTGAKPFAYVTPFGGVALLWGWACLFGAGRGAGGTGHGPGSFEEERKK